MKKLFNKKQVIFILIMMIIAFILGGYAADPIQSFFSGFKDGFVGK